MRLRAWFAGAILALVTLLGIGLTPTPAHANYMLGVPHTHLAGCTVYDCWTWILQNGAVMRGPTSQLQGQYGYVLVVCSQIKPDGYWQISTLGPWGPKGNDGAWYPYCVNPADGNGIRWNIYPGTS